MKITKFEHACLLLEKNGTTLLIDPGSFTTLPDNLPKITFVIITEEHFDHFNVENLEKIVSNNPNVKVYTTQAVQKSLSNGKVSVVTVTGEQTISMDDFTVKLREVNHAVVYKNSPCKSLTVLVDTELYYPSDSFETTKEKVRVLALPTSGPWYKVSTSIEFANTVDSETVVPTHNALNSEIGNTVTQNYIESNIDQSRKLISLAPGESLEI